MYSEPVIISKYITTKTISERKITSLPKHPLFEERVDEEDWRLGEGHQEVAYRQVYDEIVRRIAKLLVTENTNTSMEGML